MLDLAAGIGDDEWGNGGVVLGEETTVGGVFAFPSEHISEHASEMRRD